MWVFSPAPNDTKMWKKKKENDFFLLQEHKSLSSRLYGLMKSLSATTGAHYRITLKCGAQAEQAGVDQLIATSEDWESIDRCWCYIETEILPICSFFDRTEPNEERELWQFLNSKLRSLADIEKDKEQERAYAKAKRTSARDSSRRNDFCESSGDEPLTRERSFNAISRREKNQKTRFRNWKKLFPSVPDTELIHGKPALQ